MPIQPTGPSGTIMKYNGADETEWEGLGWDFHCMIINGDDS